MVRGNLKEKKELKKWKEYQNSELLKHADTKKTHKTE